MAIIQFIDEDYVVSVEYETEEDIREIAQFESIRITSLLDRDMKVKTEFRVWDSIRKISVKHEDCE